MFRHLSSMTAKGMKPRCSRSITLRPSVPIYDCGRMGKMAEQKSLYSSELQPKSTNRMCDDTPVGINGMNNLAKLLMWNSFGKDGVNVTDHYFTLIFNRQQ